MISEKTGSDFMPRKFFDIIWPDKYQQCYLTMLSYKQIVFNLTYLAIDYIFITAILLFLLLLYYMSTKIPTWL